VLPSLRMPQGELARRLRSSRVTIDTLLQERRDLLVGLAARTAHLPGHSPESWLRMQDAVDLWHVAQDKPVLARIEPLPKDRIAA
jgi:addiction module HigA family antidote